MAEKYYVVRNREIAYEGYFSLAELYYIIDELISRLGYDKVEAGHNVKVFKTHKEVEMKLTPDKPASDYIKYIMEIKLKVRDLVDVNLQNENIDKPVQRGKVQIKLSGLHVTNRDGQWSHKPMFYLIRTLIDKFIYAGYFGDTKGELKSHVELMASEISGYLNMNKYRFGTQSGHVPVPRR